MLHGTSTFVTINDEIQVTTKDYVQGMEKPILYYEYEKCSELYRELGKLHENN